MFLFKVLQVLEPARDWTVYRTQVLSRKLTCSKDHRHYFFISVVPSLHDMSSAEEGMSRVLLLVILGITPIR